MKASGTVSGDRGAGTHGRDRSLRPRPERPLGGRRRGLAALESGPRAPKRPCLGLEGGKRPTWRRRRSCKTREEAAPPLGGGRDRRAAQLGRRGDLSALVVSFSSPSPGLACSHRCAFHGVGPWRGEIRLGRGWFRGGWAGGAGVLTLRAVCLSSASSCGSTRWSGDACPRRNARPRLCTACGSSPRTMLWPSPGSGTSFLS